MAIIKYGKLRREQKNAHGYIQKKSEKSSPFSDILNSEVHRASEEGATEYIVTVYGRDMKLSPMQYRTREYHY